MQNNRPYQKELPDKLYFKIGEVGEIAELPTYVLRFWETEFTKIKPKRTSSGQRLYSKNDIELILKIKHLLHNKKYTIQGAKRRLKSKEPEKKADSLTNILDDIRSELKSIRDLLT
ncbi:MAG: MerR family transcriptional regulator [Desulfobacteraceae bacterium]|nr:MerR family transcriptional regulator [Desulfobacteraceae bacterium]